MDITSIGFVLLFLPVVLLIYHFGAERYRKIWILIVSVIFYTIGSIHSLKFILLAMLVDVAIGRALCKCKRKTGFVRPVLLIMGVTLNVLFLGYYKYYCHYRGISVVLPLGISFFTFKAISYIVDCYSEKISLSDSVIDDLIYLLFFPQMLSGPIARRSDFNKINYGLFYDGVYRFLCGFSKKVLLANILAGIVNEVFTSSLNDLSTFYMWFGSVCYSLQLFYDFAGYSDMAIGMSMMFGYECPENFIYPYMTKSFSEFWRRWHVTLGAWFRDYVYIPLGGSKKGGV